MKIFTIENGKVTEGAKVDSFTLKGAGVSIPANIIGEEGRGGICMKEITIVEIIELNRNGVRVEEQDLPLPLQFHYFDDNGGSPDGNYDEDAIA